MVDSIANTNPTFKQLLRSPTLLLAFGFGSGLSPKAPGTVGTLAAIPLWWLLAQLPLAGYLSVVLISAIVGIYICDQAAKTMGVTTMAGLSGMNLSAFGSLWRHCL